MHADGETWFWRLSIQFPHQSVANETNSRINDPESRTFFISFHFRTQRQLKAIPSLLNLDIITYGRCAENFVLHHWSDNNLKLIKNSCLAGRSDGSFSPSSRISFAENLRRTFFAPISNSEVEKSKVRNGCGPDGTFLLEIEGLITWIRNVVLWNGKSEKRCRETSSNPIKVWMYKV